jgi:hypothetical protein
MGSGVTDGIVAAATAGIAGSCQARSRMVKNDQVMPAQTSSGPPVQAPGTRP